VTNIAAIDQTSSLGDQWGQDCLIPMNYEIHVGSYGRKFCNTIHNDRWAAIAAHRIN
jgi:hypothetical protein